MNAVKLKINPYKGINSISVNGGTLSAFSELNNFMKEPFLLWSPQLISAIEREVNDSFSLTVVAERFETSFLRDLQESYEICREFHAEDFPMNLSVSQRLGIVEQLADRYIPGNKPPINRMPIYMDASLSFVTEGNCRMTSNIQSAFVILAADVQKAEEYADQFQQKLILTVSENAYVKAMSKRFIWAMPAEKVEENLSAMEERFVLIPRIQRITRMLLEVTDQMSPQDIQYLTAANEVEPVVLVDEIPPVEAGRPYTLRYRAVPDGMNLPDIHVESSNSLVATSDGKTIVGKKSGFTVLSFFRADEGLPFKKVNIQVFETHFVQKITLHMDSNVTGETRKVQIGYDFSPRDAQDAGRLQWLSDHPEIAEVDQNGVLYARREGVCHITLRGRDASDTIEVVVKPAIHAIRLSDTSWKCLVGETIPVWVQYAPQHCYNPSYTWHSSHPEVAMVEKGSEGEFIRATGLGDCRLTCTADEGGASAYGEIHVGSSFEREDHRHPWLLATFIFCILTVASSFAGLLPYNIVGMAITLVLGVIAISKNSLDRAWAILLMIVSFVVVLIR